MDETEGPHRADRRGDSDPLGAAPVAPARRRRLVVAAALLLVFALLLAANLGAKEGTPRGGWDETTHLELPAARMLTAVSAGRSGAAFSALADCSQYPFAAPVYLALAQGVFGRSETVGRWAMWALWVATLGGLFLLGAELARGAAGRPTVRGAPYVALVVPALLAFASPLGARYCGTLFLEVPVACAVTWTLVAWLRRRSRPGLASEALAGAALTCAVFTKFNYGVLLAAGLGLDWLVESLAARRVHPARLAALLAVPLVTFLWWSGSCGVPGGSSAT